MVCGESIILRQSNYSGIIAFIGATEFASGLWIGIELDAPLGMIRRCPFLFEKFKSVFRKISKIFEKNPKIILLHNLYFLTNSKTFRAWKSNHWSSFMSQKYKKMAKS
jgi:dynactin complex subunit